MIKFGPSGNSDAYHNAGNSGSENSAKWVKDLGLDCFEYSFGRGFNVSIGKLMEIRDSFEKEGIELSLHAPYFINLATPEEEKRVNSFNYILQTANISRVMNAKRIVIHPATQGKMTREEAVNLTYERLEYLACLIKSECYEDVKFCLETMGKLAQIGTVEEIARFCTIAPFYYPCVDFGHVNAREQGSLKTKEDYLRNLDIIENISGREKLEGMHIHFSKIMYSAKGEIKHLTFEDNEFGPEFEPLAEALIEKKLEPYIICESAGTQDIDSKYMKEVYLKSKSL